MEEWHEDLLEDSVHVLERVLGHLHEDEHVVHGVFGDLVLDVSVGVEPDLVEELQDTHGLGKGEWVWEVVVVTLRCLIQSAASLWIL